MESRPEYDRQVDEALEACRPGSEDLVSEPELRFLAGELATHPELDERYELLQRLDQRLAAAYAQVPVPPDLAARILTHCAETPEALVPATAAEAATPPAAPRWRPTRWTVLASLAAAASILALVWLGFRGGPPLSKEALIQEANHQFAQGLPTGQPGQLLQDRQPPVSYPACAELRRSLETRWRWIGDFAGHPAVAYDLVGVNQAKATLYVLRTRIPSLPSTPTLEREPSIATGQCSIAAWQTEDLVYVLVVEGGPRRFPQFLDLPRGPVT